VDLPKRITSTEKRIGLILSLEFGLLLLLKFANWTANVLGDSAKAYPAQNPFWGSTMPQKNEKRYPRVLLASHRIAENAKAARAVQAALTDVFSFKLYV
jgi:hypothetical protein